MLCLSAFELYSRWVPLFIERGTTFQSIFLAIVVYIKRPSFLTFISLLRVRRVYSGD